MPNSKKSESGALYIANIALRLLVICAFIAALVAGVNAITKDKIALNQKVATAEALSAIYASDGMYFSVTESGDYAVTNESGEPVGSCDPETDLALLENIDAVYTIRAASGNVFGYCVEASPMCFKDEVGMLIAVRPDASVKDVRIISLKETKGIGDKVTESAFLSKFTGIKSGFSSDAATMKDIVIAGATRTSEPVTKTVDTALAQIEALLAGEEDNA